MELEKEDGQINLIDYLRVVIRRKWLIFTVFLLAIIGASLFSFLKPKVYKTETVLEIGTVGGSIIENPSQIIGRVNENIYSAVVEKKLGIKEWQYPKIKISNPNGTNLIVMEIQSSNPPPMKSILEEINNSIILDHEGKIKLQRDLIESNIKTDEKKLKLVEDDIQSTENKIGPMDQDIIRIDNKTKLLEAEKKVLEDKEKALEEAGPYQEMDQQLNGSLFALLDIREKLNNTKQEIENLYLTINSLKQSKQDINIRINTLRKDVEELNAQIDSLKMSLRNIKSTSVVKAPVTDDTPIGPHLLFNLLMAAILGLFLGTFLAFIKEWWVRNKVRL